MTEKIRRSGVQNSQSRVYISTLASILGKFDAMKEKNFFSLFLIHSNRMLQVNMIS